MLSKRPATVIGPAAVPFWVMRPLRLLRESAVSVSVSAAPMTPAELSSAPVARVTSAWPRMLPEVLSSAWPWVSMANTGKW